LIFATPFKSEGWSKTEYAHPSERVGDPPSISIYIKKNVCLSVCLFFMHSVPVIASVTKFLRHTLRTAGRSRRDRRGQEGWDEEVG
jgi:hypothetical protein